MLEIVAELSANHLGSLDRALKIVDAAAEAGADLFKVQVWEPETMCFNQSIVLPKGPWKGRSLFELYREAWTPWGWLPTIFERARARGMEPFGAAFDFASVDYLESLGVKRHKVASFELVDLPLIRYMASKDKPMILSTGMATPTEVERAVWVALEQDLNNTVTTLKCTSAYPADPADAGLSEAKGLFLMQWGLSDHTEGIGVAVAAVALGASMIEKHLTLSRADGGPDAGFSMEPAEFAQMVKACGQAYAAIQPRQGPAKGEDATLRRSLWVIKDTKAGEPLILNHNVRTARPACGLPPSTSLESARAARDLKAFTPLTSEDINAVAY
jgi:N-acetylneuraminate synthase